MIRAHLIYDLPISQYEIPWLIEAYEIPKYQLLDKETASQSCPTQGRPLSPALPPRAACLRLRHRASSAPWHDMVNLR